MTEQFQGGRPHFIEPNNKLPATNPFGEWIDNFTEKRRINIRPFGREIGLPGLGYMRRQKPHEISLYSMQNVLEKVEDFDVTDEELNSLADVVEMCLSEAISVNGKIYDRLPPSVARSKQKDIEGKTYTANQFAAEYNLQPGRVQWIKSRLSIDVLFTPEDGDRILQYIKESDERRNQIREMPEGFAATFSEANGVTESQFVEQLSTKTGITKSSAYTIKKGRNPNPEEFSLILQSYPLTEEQVEKLADVWLTAFRKTITIQDLSRELKVGRECIRQNATKLGFGGRDKWGWDAIEAVRAYRNTPKTVSSKHAAQVRFERRSVPKPRVPKIKNDNPAIRRRNGKNSEVVRASFVIPEVKAENRPEYPDVLTNDYISSLTSSERDAVSKLQGSSYSFPVNVDGNNHAAIEYLIKEQIFPKGASIRKRMNGRMSYYYLDYRSTTT